MDGRRFDTLTSAIARRRSRRDALRDTGAGLAAVLGGVAGLRAASAQEATPAASGGAPTFLFVQTATGGRFAPNPQVGTPAVEGTPTPGGGAEYLLTLDGHNGNTIYFSDRPDRIFGDTPTQQFLDGLGFSPVNPPNAALVSQLDDDEADEIVIVELVEPTYDEAAGTVTYGVNVLGAYAGEPLTQIVVEEAAPPLPESFGRASLFIDECPALTNCLYEGAHQLTFDAGPIPGGPYKQCWEPGSGACKPCDESVESLITLCKQTYDCGNICYPG